MINISVEVLEKASEGDITAFEEVYKAASSFVYNVALKITRNSTEAEEITQDVFMKIYHKLKDFDFRSTFKTWLHRITVNTAINQYNKSHREVKDRVDYDGIVESLTGNSATDKNALQIENEQRLNILLGALTPEHKACIILREIEGLSYEEISAVSKIPVNTVRSRLKRARETLLESVRKGLIKNEMR